MMTNLLVLKLWLSAKLQEFLHDERGDVNIVSIVVLIGVAVVLAILFKDAIRDLLDTLLETIGTNADNALGTLPSI